MKSQCARLVPGDSVQSVISFDQGGEWVPLRKPVNSKCDATAKDPAKVRTESRKYVFKVKCAGLFCCCFPSAPSALQSIMNALF